MPLIDTKSHNVSQASRPFKEEEWQAVLRRDAAYDGLFFYGVLTTGIYCRPSCPARKPKFVNAVHLADHEMAVASGFRACKRCRPEELILLDSYLISPRLAEPHCEKIIALCRGLEGADPFPKLEEMAKEVGLSPAQFRRVFHSYLGVTPRAFCEALRLKRVKAGLADERPITEVIFNSGYNSLGRYYEKAPTQLGMTSREVRAKGAGVALKFGIGETRFGAVLVAMSARGVAAIEIGTEAGVLLDNFQDRFSNARLVGDDDAFNEHLAKVLSFIERRPEKFPLPLDIQGTAFQRQVWEALMAIPYGETRTYSEIANAIDNPAATRAVAGACAANKIAVAIPCHRVIRLDGSFSGYRWGIETKRALLAREQSGVA